MNRRTLHFEPRTFPIRGVFRISRGSKTQADAVIVQITEGGVTGRGECIPYARYGETVQGVLAQIASVADAVRDGLDLQGLQTLLPPGSARNALDCALWDLRSKISGHAVSSFAGLKAPLSPVTTAFTLSLDSASAMAEVARTQKHLPLLKLKWGAMEIWNASGRCAKRPLVPG
jgi:L-alanine-DL-glutamate epimerase-like enolase superfamily enzyme